MIPHDPDMLSGTEPKLYDDTEREHEDMRARQEWLNRLLISYSPEIADAFLRCYMDGYSVKELAAEDNLILLCGHYEGVDQRVLDELNFEEISVGDYVVTGGELPALILTDAVARLQDGVLPNEDAYSIESHYNGLLEHPQYTRPEEWRGRRVPEVLISGHHANIKKWQDEMSLKVTKEKRPDMVE